MTANLKPISLDPSPLQLALLRDNIRQEYRQAQSDQIDRGLTWYRNAHQLAGMIAPTVEIGAAVIAILSANNSWHKNMAEATKVFTGQQIRTLGDKLRKINRVMTGEDPRLVLPMGRKTGQFFLCILDPSDRDAIVIDRHAHDVARGYPFGNIDRGLSHGPRYGIFADAYVDVAEQVGLRPMELQAITWTSWVERKVDR